MLKSILTNVLSVIYTGFPAAIIITVLFMVLYPQLQQRGCRALFKELWTNYAHSKQFRKTTLLVLYVSLILNRTMFIRITWQNPLSDVLGGWVPTYVNNKLNTESIENLVMLLPMMPLLMWTEILPVAHISGRRILKKSLQYCFLFSLSIEMIQLIFHIGTFQLSDLVYNTLGGLVGGLLYYVCQKCKISKRKF